MEHDPQRVADTKAWLAKAAEDRRAGEFERTAKPPLTADILFHAQQLAEKALKAFLTWHDRPFRKTHNLVELGEQCAAISPDLEPLLRRAAPLTEYAWRFRYPGTSQDCDPTEGEAALALGCEVFEAVLARLPGDVRP